MRFQALATFFDRHADTFLKGDLDVVAAQFITPIPVYAGEDLLVLPDAAALRRALATFRWALVADGITQMTSQIDAVELPHDGVQQIWLSWHYAGDTGLVRRKDRVTYVVRGAADGDAARIEMIHFTQLAYPEIVHRFALAK
ncbi:MAG: hypothetical protein AAGF60_04410 [Pseudomonadota bacterium]